MTCLRLCVFETQLDLTFSYPYSNSSHTVTLTAASPLILSYSLTLVFPFFTQGGKTENMTKTMTHWTYPSAQSPLKVGLPLTPSNYYIYKLSVFWKGNRKWLDSLVSLSEREESVIYSMQVNSSWEVNSNCVQSKISLYYSTCSSCCYCRGLLRISLQSIVGCDKAMHINKDFSKQNFKRSIQRSSGRFWVSSNYALLLKHFLIVTTQS